MNLLATIWFAISNTSGSRQCSDKVILLLTRSNNKAQEAKLSYVESSLVLPNVGYLKVLSMNRKFSPLHLRGGGPDDIDANGT